LGCFPLSEIFSAERSLSRFFTKLPAIGARGPLTRVAAAEGLQTVRRAKDLALKTDEVYIYAVDEAGTLRIAPRGSAGRLGQKHTQLTGGRRAKAAGEMVQSADGTITINGQSRRYIRQARNATDAVKSALESLGKTVTKIGKEFP
jgi:hypothetical protein